jgi:Holliday junction resolvase-like predicted endonuclease
MPDPRHILGRSAERAVEDWLLGTGWEVIGRRSRPPGGGEVDLVAIDPSGVLVGVEVRARRTRRAGSAAASVDDGRIRRLRGSIARIAAGCGRHHAGLRIDLVTAQPLAGRDRWHLVRIPGIG